MTNNYKVNIRDSSFNNLEVQIVFASLNVGLGFKGFY